MMRPVSTPSPSPSHPSALTMLHSQVSTQAPGARSSCRGLGAPRGLLFRRPQQLRRCWRKHDPLRVRAAAAPETEELSEEKKDIQKLLAKPYKYGFKTIIESEVREAGGRRGRRRPATAAGHRQATAARPPAPLAARGPDPGVAACDVAGVPQGAERGRGARHLGQEERARVAAGLQVGWPLGGLGMVPNCAALSFSAGGKGAPALSACSRRWTVGARREAGPGTERLGLTGARRRRRLPGGCALHGEQGRRGAWNWRGRRKGKGLGERASAACPAPAAPLPRAGSRRTASG